MATNLLIVTSLLPCVVLFYYIGMVNAAVAQNTISEERRSANQPDELLEAFQKLTSAMQTEDPQNRQAAPRRLNVEMELGSGSEETVYFPVDHKMKGHDEDVADNRNRFKTCRGIPSPCDLALGVAILVGSLLSMLIISQMVLLTKSYVLSYYARSRAIVVSRVKKANGTFAFKIISVSADKLKKIKKVPVSTPSVV